MIKVQKENIVYRISEEELKDYLKKGFKAIQPQKGKNNPKQPQKGKNKK